MSEIVTEISEDDWPDYPSSRCWPRTPSRPVSPGHCPTASGSRPTRRTAGSARCAGAPVPRVVFLHGGGQNAHTWDTVIVGLGEPALAVDLPGHGHSGVARGRRLLAAKQRRRRGAGARELAPNADLIVGMSLGGLTAIRVGAIAPAPGARTRPRRRHPVGVAPARRADRRTAGHGGADARRPGVPQFPGDAGRDRRRGTAPRGQGAAPRRVPQLPPAGQRQLDVALRQPSAPSPTSAACGTTSRRWPRRSP